jgi:sugar lactone lactonase YvrE
VETLRSSVLAGGFVYGESPRWHDDRLWFSDMHGGGVKTVDAAGNIEVALEFEHPSGLGWLPDGTLLVSVFRVAHVMRVDAGGVTVYADLSDRGWSMNDMVVGPDGRAYVDLYTSRSDGIPVGAIVLLTPDGESRIVASDLATPNGLAIAPDGSTLVASETFSGRVLAYTIQPDGGLVDERVFANLGEHRRPDGLCFDAEGAVWVASSFTGEFLRVLEGGAMTHVIETPGCWAIAPVFGGPDRRTLYLLVADTELERFRHGESSARIEYLRVDVPGAGWP